MNQEQILEHSSLIAVFHGWQCMAKSKEGKFIYEASPALIGNLRLISLDDMEYHKSWDWQIPVWARVSDMVCLHNEAYYRSLETRYHMAIGSNYIKMGYEVLYEAVDYCITNRVSK